MMRPSVRNGAFAAKLFTIALGAAVVFAIRAGGDAAFAREEKKEPIEWKIEDGSVYIYDRIDYWIDKDTGEKRQRKTDVPFVIFGYELDKRGNARFRDESLLGPAVLPYYFIFSLPEVSEEGEKAHVTRDFTANQTFRPFTVDGDVTYVAEEQVKVEEPVFPEGEEDVDPEDVKTRTVIYRYHHFRGELKIGRCGKPAADGRANSTINDGEITYDSWFDPKRGCIVKVHYTCRFDYVTNKGAKSEESEKEFELREVFDYNSKELTDRVEDAVKIGVDYIKAEMDKDTYYDNPSQYAQGEKALAVTALYLSGVDKNDKTAAKCLDYVRKQPLERVYSVSLLVMALDAYCTPLYEIERSQNRLEEGKKFPTVRRKPSNTDSALISKAVYWLQGNKSGKESGAWHYPSTGDPDYDNSNSQYAVLGLLAADRCHVDVDPSQWKAILAHWLRDQEVTGPKYALGAKGTSAVRTQAKGWPYKKDGEVYGSMTCAGVASVAIASQMLEKRGQLQASYAKKADASLKSGLAWLAKYYSVTRNPQRGNTRYYYYLYGLERACVFAGVRKLNGRDWYREGAAYLTAIVRKGNAWGGVESTSFALLFLKMATTPVTR